MHLPAHVRRFAVGCLLSSALVAQAVAAAPTSSTLAKHQMSIFPGLTLDFFSEPVERYSPTPAPGGSGTPAGGSFNKSRVFISPFVTVPLDGVFITDRNGEWIKAAQLSDAAIASNSRVAISLTLMLPPYETEQSWKLRMIGIMNNLDPLPPLSLSLGGMSISLGGPMGGPMGGPGPSLGFQPGPGGYTPTPFASMLAARPDYQWYLNRYSFEPMAVRGLKVTISCNGVDFPPTLFASDNQFVTLGSTFRAVVSPTDVATLRAFRRGQFQVKAEYVMALTNTQIASVVTDLSGYSNHLATQFAKDVSRVSSSGGGFFIFSTASSSVARWLQDEASSNGTSMNSLSRTIVLRNVTDPILVKAVDQFMWPVASNRDEVIAAHRQAAADARAAGKPDLATAHDHYVQALTQAAANEPPKVDAVKAAAALATKDILGFLASGVAIEDRSSSGSFTYRKLRSSSFSSSDVQALNAMFISSVESQNAVILSDFPLQNDISRARDEDPEGLIARRKLAQIAREKQAPGPWLLDLTFFALLVEDEDAPGAPAAAPPRGR